MPPARIGLDFGGVIVRRGPLISGEDTSLTGAEGEAIAQPGAIAAAGELAQAVEGRVWIISKAKRRMRERTLAWLAMVDFFARAGMRPDNIRFCAERGEKAALCRELGITHFIDDRIHVMQILRHVTPHLYLFGDEAGRRRCPPWAAFVSGWDEAVEMVKRSLNGDHPPGKSAL